MGPLDAQLDQLRERFGEVVTKALPSGAILVTVVNVSLPPGWNKPSTSIRFLVPPGYPFAALDCFWADNDLLLDGGRMPQNASAGNAVAGDGGVGLWFSWHLLQPWNPNRDTLSSWMNVVIDRLGRLQ